VPQYKGDQLCDESDHIDLRHSRGDQNTEHSVSAQNGARLVSRCKSLGDVKNARSRLLPSTQRWKLKHEHTKNLELRYYRSPKEKRLAQSRAVGFAEPVRATETRISRPKAATGVHTLHRAPKNNNLFLEF
jgi:hypothetical protein